MRSPHLSRRALPTAIACLLSTVLAAAATTISRAQRSEPATVAPVAPPTSSPEDSPPASEPVCAPTDAALDALRLNTARLLRVRTPRPWTTAGDLLVSIDALCEAARTSWATCGPTLREPAREAAGACSRATERIWDAIQQEEELREGRRELRRLPRAERERDYEYLVGQYEHRQLTALSQLPGVLATLEQHLGEFEATRATSDATSQTATEPALAALRAAQRQLTSLNATIQRDIAPPPSGRSARR
ncbi:MAG: hypothetical protein KC593_14435 [Myxococcales bacterium]|nr:hypothetical protein [Myxococcales bacterium]